MLKCIRTNKPTRMTILEYFFQYALLNLAHRDFNSLCHPNHEQLPSQLQWFGAVVHHFPAVWTNNEKLESWLITQGHGQFYITTTLSYVASLRDLFYLIRMQVIANEQLVTVQASVRSSLTLDTYQQAAVHHIDRAVSLREQFYSNDQPFNCDQYLSDSDDDTDSTSEKRLDKS